MSQTYFFCGIGGSGMSALAAILLSQGNRIIGSDRSFDQGCMPEKFSRLAAQGITLVPQDGTGMTPFVDVLVVSSAIEDSIPDVRAARGLNIPIRKRAEILADLFNGARGISVGGTSGKSTVTGMLGTIFSRLGQDPTVMNGGAMLDLLAEEPNSLGNARTGAGEIFVTEADESDGSIALYNPAIALLNNITLDHKPIAELRPLFRDYLLKAREGAVINLDDPEAAALVALHIRTVTFSLTDPAADFIGSALKPRPDGISLTVTEKATGKSLPLDLRVPGRHNAANALAAIASASLAGVRLEDSIKMLAEFCGIQRRLQLVGTAGGVTVIDDFAHNPDKVAATLQTLREFEGRLWLVFQPHGFGPMRMMRTELVQAFAVGMGADDVLLMPEIYYAGGTAVRDISSRDIINDLASAGRQGRFFDKREEIPAFLETQVRPGDRVVVMGARDDTLIDYAKDILQRFSSSMPASIRASA